MHKHAQTPNTPRDSCWRLHSEPRTSLQLYWGDFPERVTRETTRWRNLGSRLYGCILRDLSCSWIPVHAWGKWSQFRETNHTTQAKIGRSIKKMLLSLLLWKFYSRELRAISTLLVWSEVLCRMPKQFNLLLGLNPWLNFVLVHKTFSRMFLNMPYFTAIFCWGVSRAQAISKTKCCVHFFANHLWFRVSLRLWFPVWHEGYAGF